MNRSFSDFDIRGFDFMGTIYMRNNKSCPFCDSRLIHRIVYCPNHINLPCLVCESCKVYLYTEEYYNVLFQLAKNINRKLNRDVYKYQLINNSTQQSKKTKKGQKSKSKKKIKNEKKQFLLIRIFQYWCIARQVL